jgi:hypothetical protein
MENNLDEQDFFIALSYLPIVRERIIRYCDEIISKDKNHQEAKIEELITSILLGMELSNIKVISTESNEAGRNKLLRTTLRQLISSQIPFSELANKIRKNSINRPSIFE